jgi:hypothetical protein
MIGQPAKPTRKGAKDWPFYAKQREKRLAVNAGLTTTARPRDLQATKHSVRRIIRHFPTRPFALTAIHQTAVRPTVRRAPGELLFVVAAIVSLARSPSALSALDWIQIRHAG